MEGEFDTQQNVKNHEISDTTETKDTEDQSESQSFIILLKRCYNNLTRSRLVHHRDTDMDALRYFEEMCNKALPRNKHELDTKDIIRELYYADKTSFARCLVGAPHYVLLTEARAMVLHFGIQDLVYIEWKDDAYLVKNNEQWAKSRRTVKKSVVPTKKHEIKPRVKVIKKEYRPHAEGEASLLKKMNDRLDRLERVLEVTKDIIISENPFEKLSDATEQWGDLEEVSTN